MTTIINGSSPSITFSDGSAQTSATRPFQNRIINGAMVIDQRNAGASVTANDGTFSVDRWKCIATANGKFSMQQNAGSVTPPAGFTNYLGCTSTAATSVGASDFYQIRQVIEGFNFADCGWGTANAKTVTLSFWVRSSLTGTHGGMVTNAAGSRSYPFSYTINAANTWEYETITIPGDTTGTWIGATNGGGLQLGFNLGAGSTYSGTANTWAGTFYGAPTGAVQVVATNGATFYITGVQLEVGSTATSFDYRPYGTELALCQRYYWQQGGSPYTRFAGGIALGRSSTIATSMAIPPVTMRAFPTISSTNIGNTSILGTAVSSISVDADTNFGPIRVVATVSGGLTTGTGYEWESNNNSTTRVAYSSEL